VFSIRQSAIVCRIPTFKPLFCQIKIFIFLLDRISVKDIVFVKLFQFVTVDAQLGHLIGKGVAVDSQKRRRRAFESS